MNSIQETRDHISSDMMDAILMYLTQSFLVGIHPCALLNWTEFDEVGRSRVDSTTRRIQVCK